MRILASSFTDTVNVTVGGGGLKKSDQVSHHDSEVTLIFAMIIILSGMLILAMILTAGLLTTIPFSHFWE